MTDGFLEASIQSRGPIANGDELADYNPQPAEPATDPSAGQVQATSTVEIAGGVTAVTVSAGIGLTPYGRQYEKPLEVTQTFTASGVLSDEQAATKANDLTVNIAGILLDLAPRYAAYMTEQQAAAGISQPAARAAAPAATGTPAEQAAAIANGSATAGSDGWERVLMGQDKNGRDEYKYFPSLAEMTPQEFEDRVKARFCEEFEVHPDHVRVWDNRKDLLARKDKVFSAARVTIKKDAPIEALIAGCVAYVNFNRDKSIHFGATKALSGASLSVKVALSQPAGAAPAAQQAPASVPVAGQPSSRPF